MSEKIWIVRSPEGRVIGASAVSAVNAVNDSPLLPFPSSTHAGLMRAITDGVTEAEFHGHTLTREPLTPSDGTSSTGTAGTPTPASAAVVVLDEWRVAYTNGSTTFAYFSAHEAAKRAAKDNETFEGCGARVMRVCLQEVSDA